MAGEPSGPDLQAQEDRTMLNHNYDYLVEPGSVAEGQLAGRVT